MPGLLLAVAACKGAPSAPPVVNQSAGSSPHASRHALVRETFAALAAGRVDDLVALANLDEVFDTALVCESTKVRAAGRTRVRENLEAAVAGARGTTFEVLSIDRLDRSSDSLASGQTTGDCKATRPIQSQEAHVRVRMSAEGSSREHTVRITLLEVGDRWYLGRLPAKVASNPVDTVGQVRGFADRMCACKDKACADKVNDDYTAWGSDFARRAAEEEPARPDPDQVREMTELATRYTECYVKLANGAP